jgi:HAD superfamily hydrolase (TIGR01549 family)
VIFDLGDTLAVPEDWTGAMRRSFERMGLETSGLEGWLADAQKVVGHPEGHKTSRSRLRAWRDAWALAVLEAAGITEGLLARTALLRRLVECEILWRPPHPEIPGMLDRLVAQGYRLGIASNNDGRTREKVGALGLTHPFEVIVDSLEERTAKPDPDLLVIAAEGMKVLPYRCIYVGNDPDKDVVAAHAAGMPAAWVDREGRGPGNYRAEIYLTDLAGLPQAIVERFS